jgi:diguanylate cyclase (GGDEF)-like protein
VKGRSGFAANGRYCSGNSRHTMNLRSFGQEETSRTSELRREIRRLEGRDLQLWIVGLAVIVILSLGFAAMVFPNVVWRLHFLPAETRYLPQLFFGFIILIVLFEIYTLQRRRAFQSARDELVHELVRREAAEKLALVDQLTEVFNRRYLDQLLAKEVNRADRRGSSIAFLMVDIAEFKSFNTRFGHKKGDHLLGDVAQLLKRTFRASDSIVRLGGDEFLVVMPDTDETSALRGVDRLLHQAEAWNRAHPEEDYRLTLGTGVAVYAKGADIAQVLETADQKLYQRKSV